jgi:hypothetical protein
MRLGGAFEVEDQVRGRLGRPWEPG